jgi:uncharacterized protein YndB with AHSA1/START domain
MSSVPPVRKQVMVEASAEHAFRVFTQGIDRWWPREPHIGKSPLKQQILEPHVSGRWYSVCEDGSQCDVGKVLVWEPPRRLVLAWQITAQWQHDATFLTEVEVTFTPEGPRRTRVDLEHRGLDAYGAAAAAIRKEIDAPGGWGKIVEMFASAAAEPEPTPKEEP